MQDHDAAGSRKQIADQYLYSFFLVPVFGNEHDLGLPEVPVQELCLTEVGLAVEAQPPWLHQGILPVVDEDIEDNL